MLARSHVSVSATQPRLTQSHLEVLLAYAGHLASKEGHWLGQHGNAHAPNIPSPRGRSVRAAQPCAWLRGLLPVSQAQSGAALTLLPPGLGTRRRRFTTFPCVELRPDVLEKKNAKTNRPQKASRKAARRLCTQRCKGDGWQSHDAASQLSR